MDRHRICRHQSIFAFMREQSENFAVEVGVGGDPSNEEVRDMQQALKPSEKVETPREMAERVGIPVSNVRYLIRTGQLAHVFTSPGRRKPKIPLGAWEQYLAKQVGG